MTTETKAVVKKAKQESAFVEFVPFGASDTIRLTASMVKQFIAVPTKSGQLPTERDCIRFIMLCRGKRANPFEGDCFLIGYDSQNGPSFSLVCGIDLFLKRAEQNPDYDGKESGVIVKSGAELVERKGTLALDDETLVGGWCKVYRKNHSQPEYKAVKFSTYDTGRSRWMKDPGGMIVKVAESQALRAAYPTALGGLYTQEEMQRVTEMGEGVANIHQQDITMPVEVTVEQIQPASDPKTEPPKTAQPENQTGDTVDVVIGEIKNKEFKKKDGSEGQRYYFKAGDEYYSTFDAKMADALRPFVGQSVTLKIERSAKGNNVLAIISDSQEPPAEENLPGLSADDSFVRGCK